MSGTIHTLIPNQLGIDNAGSYSPHPSTGGATIATVTNDDSDATWMVGIGVGTVTLGFSSYALAPGERALRVRSRMRVAGPLLSPVVVQTRVGNFTDGAWAPTEVYPVAALGWITGPWHSTYPLGGVEWGQAQLDKVQTQVQSSLNGGSTVVVYEEKVDVEVLVAPTVVCTAPTGTNPGATHRPTIRWTPTIGDGYPQKGYRIKMWNTDVNPAPVWGDTRGLVADTNYVAGPPTSGIFPQSFPNGNYAVMVIVAKDFNGEYWWSAPSAAQTFTISDAPHVPTSVGPTGLILTGYPTLRALLARSAFNYSYPVAAEWQIAADPSFATITQDWIDRLFDNGGVHYLDTTPALGASASALTPATWYLRCRARDQGGGVSAWSDPPVSFDVAYQATVTPITPAQDEYVQIGEAFLIGWDFIGFLPNDTMSAGQVVIEDMDGNVVYDSGKLATDTPIFAAELDAAGDYQWQARSWDQNDVPSQFTTLVQFHAADLSATGWVTIPGVNVTTAIDSITTTLTDPTATFGWLLIPASGRTQASWEAIITDANTNEDIYDSGVITGAGDTFQIPPLVLVQGGQYVLTVHILDSAGLNADPQIINIFTQFPPPDPITGLVSSVATFVPPSVVPGVFTLPTVEYVQLSWDSTGLGVEFSAYEVQRLDGQAWVTIALIGAESVPSAYDIECRRTPVGVTEQYRVRVVDVTLGPSAWSTFDPVIVHTPNETDLVLASNWTPDLTVAYQDEGPTYDFAVDAVAKRVRIEGRALPVMFKARAARGDTFSRVLIIAMPDPKMGALLTGEAGGRIVFAPLEARVDDTVAPYVALCDGYGKRWLCSVSFDKGTQTPNGGAYTASVTFTETDDEPPPLVSSTPWSG